MKSLLIKCFAYLMLFLWSGANYAAVQWYADQQLLVQRLSSQHEDQNAFYELERVGDHIPNIHALIDLNSSDDSLFELMEENEDEESSNYASDALLKASIAEQGARSYLEFYTTSCLTAKGVSHFAYASLPWYIYIEVFRL